MERTGKGKIKIKAKNKSRYALQTLMVTLLGLMVVAFATFDYQNIDFAEAVQATLQNIQTVFLEPELTRDTLTSVLFQLLVTFCLGILSTIIGAFLHFSALCFVPETSQAPVWSMASKASLQWCVRCRQFCGY